MVLRRIEGVEDAVVSYEEGRAVITYDPATTSPEVFIPELERMTGYDAEIVSSDGAGLPAGETVDPEELGDHDMQEHDAGRHEHEQEGSR